MRRDRSASPDTVLPSGFRQRALSVFAASLLPLNVALADVVPEAAQASGSMFDAKTAVLVIVAVAVAWGLRVVLRQYAQGADKLKVAKRDRMQPNL